MNADRPPLRVLAVGNYACANVGDELLLASLRQWVEQGGGKLTVISLNPDHTRLFHGLDAVSFYDLPAIVDQVKDADMLVVGGGGLFTDRFMFTIPQLYEYPAFTLAQFASVCYLAKQFDLRVVLWAQGVGPLVSEDARSIVVDLFGLADDVSVRDMGSLELLRELGVERPVTVAPDPVWGLDFGDVTLDLRDKFPALAGKRILVINPLVFERSEELTPKLVSALRSVLDDSWACLWIAFQTSAFDYDDYHFTLPSDRPLIEAMVAGVGPVAPHVIWDSPDIRDLLPALKQVDAALMARFHGAILGFRAQVPMMVVEYDGKVTHAADRIGMPDSQRVLVGDAQEKFVSCLATAMGKHPGSPAWTPHSTELNAIFSAAVAHGNVITEALSCAQRHDRRAWHSARFDWVLAWCTQIDRKRWLAERQLWQASDKLAQAEKTIEDNNAHSLALETSLFEANQRIERLQTQLDVLSVESASSVHQTSRHAGFFSRFMALIKR